jgi:large subunit ribosomal protein L33
VRGVVVDNAKKNRESARPSHRREELTMRDKLMLKCGNCGRHNYVRDKNKRTMTQKLAIKKYCPACRAHHEHKESKISKG